MPARVAANGWVLAAGSSPTITTDLGVTKLPGYRKEREYQLTSFSDDGLVAAGHSTGLTEGTDNQPLIWRCRLAVTGTVRPVLAASSAAGQDRRHLGAEPEVQSGTSPPVGRRDQPSSARP